MDMKMLFGVNNIGVIGGNGYTICSGSYDKTICIWDIETTKQLIVFKGHTDYVKMFVCGIFDLINKFKVFNGHTHWVYTAEYSPFVMGNNDGCNSNVICSGSFDNTIRFWDIRSNKEELCVIKGSDDDNDAILCIKFVSLKKKIENNGNDNYSINLCYGSSKGQICVWG
ncbi:hypothetical protein RFI_28633 [Reticulomyxa filosa]|uniref:Uncharacterized protein n=1 Tax=Reticulomyxa filosa TaxID=46433 RepID=X6M498_RETFI|nr:hypothetical protein RFI_28633 [Reticulomyxa filosa]|eukprot:ETO08754.1 hypothetical protein RFI_28633 [Reticulomyxa filosa]